MKGIPLSKILKYNFWLFLLAATLPNKLVAQLGFCSGNSGDPIFSETFGFGATTPLPAGTTSYAYNSVQPNDGFYNVSSNTNWFGWHNIPDHTLGDTNGRMLIINADYTPGEFYRTSVSGLCENTTYEFSSWMINLLPANHSCGRGIPINVRFEIWDNTDTQLLARGDTGDIYGTSSPNWQQYALVFQTIPAQTSVILKMLNNGSGGCGNDLALDDIVFKSCGDSVVIEDDLNMNLVSICEDEIPYTNTLKATPDFTIFSAHFYQWQESNDGINWTDIPGETNSSYTTNPINSTTFYRVKVAEDAINVNNNSCNSSSEIYEMRIVPFPDAPISNGNLNICKNDNTPLSVTVPNGVIVNWYDADLGGNLLLANNASYKPTESGVYYAEAETKAGGCKSLSRTRLQIDYYEVPEITDETIEICENTLTTIHAAPSNPNIVSSYLWNTGETTEYIDVLNPGSYSVVVSNQSCSVTKNITINQIDNPIIENIESRDAHIIISTSKTDDYLYSINGNIFQPSPAFFNIEGGQYTIYVKHRECNEIITSKHIHFYIPHFFTPNGDNINDTFNLKGIEYYNSSQVSIFDRYGKLLKIARNSSFSWNGTFSGQPLPTDDYWYVIIIEGQKFTGHFSLKR